MLLADEMEQEKIGAAIKQCEESPVEIDMGELSKKTGSDNSDMQAFNMGIALVALAKVIESNEKEQQ